DLHCTVITIADGSRKNKRPDLRGSTRFHAGVVAMWLTVLNKDTQTVQLTAFLTKDGGALGPFYFRTREVQVQGMVGQPTLVLDYVSPSEHEAAKRKLKNSDRTQKRRELYELLDKHGLWGAKVG